MCPTKSPDICAHYFHVFVLNYFNEICTALPNSSTLPNSGTLPNSSTLSSKYIAFLYVIVLLFTTEIKTSWSSWDPSIMPSRGFYAC